MRSQIGAVRRLSRDAGPAVVAIGGGNGLASALRAARLYASSVTAVVSVADDGGSSGRLVSELEILPPGDMRKCLVALAADGSPWAEALDYRFDSGELKGHSLGNLILAGLADVRGGFPEALTTVETLLECEGRVFPATTDRVSLVAKTSRGRIVGQVAIANAGTPIHEVRLEPSAPRAHPAALEAIAECDQIILGPGSLYTSVLPPLVVPEIRDAVMSARAHRVYVCNLVAQPGETDGLDAGSHAKALIDHGISFETMIYDDGGNPGGVAPEGIDESLYAVVGAQLAGESNPARHSPEVLAALLADEILRR